jgi:hypothetical protein
MAHLCSYLHTWPVGTSWTVAITGECLLSVLVPIASVASDPKQYSSPAPLSGWALLFPGMCASNVYTTCCHFSFSRHLWGWALLFPVYFQASIECVHYMLSRLLCTPTSTSVCLDVYLARVCLFFASAFGVQHTSQFWNSVVHDQNWDCMPWHMTK